MLTRRQILKRTIAASAAALSPRTTFAQPSEPRRPAPQPATAVNFDVPAGATDCHVHIIGDLVRYPPLPGAGRNYPSGTVTELLRLHRALHIDRVLLVHSISYGVDNSVTLDALKELGSRARAILALGDKTTDDELDAWEKAGVRGIRAQPRSADEAMTQLRAVGARLAGRPWVINTNVQLTWLAGLGDLLSSSPVPVVIDHFAHAQAALGVQQPGFDVLVGLLRSGKIYLKLSEITTSSKQGPDYRDVEPIAKALIAANPQRILWATDWPHTGAREFDDGRVFNQFGLWAPDPAQRKLILVDNPARLYRF